MASKVTENKTHRNECYKEVNNGYTATMKNKLLKNIAPPPPPRKIPTQKIPTWNIPAHVFEYSNPGFFNLFFAFSLLPLLSLILPFRPFIWNGVVILVIVLDRKRL